MANVIHPPIDFHPGTVHSSSPFGFGFGLSSSSSGGWPSAVTHGHTHPAAFQQLASSINQPSPLRVQKRRHEPEDDTETGRHAHSTGIRDDAMDRSPTPERPKRAAPKRARVTPSQEGGSKDEKPSKENKTSGGSDENDIDVGVLLGELAAPLIFDIMILLG